MAFDAKQADITCKASCGCGWKTNGSSAAVVASAKEHTLVTGHSTEFGGRVRLAEQKSVMIEPPKDALFYRPAKPVVR